MSGALCSYVWKHRRAGHPNALRIGVPRGWWTVPSGEAIRGAGADRQYVRLDAGW